MKNMDVSTTVDESMRFESAAFSIRYRVSVIVMLGPTVVPSP